MLILKWFVIVAVLLVVVAIAVVDVVVPVAYVTTRRGRDVAVA